MRGLAGRTAIVTGAARGIGRAIAERLVAEGMKVMLADVNTREGEKAALAMGPDEVVRFTECDVSERLDVRNLLAATLNAFGGDVHVLVNNAGLLTSQPFLELTEEEFDATLSVNLKGAFLLSQAVAKHMVARVEAGGTAGAIVNVTSVSAVVARGERVAYAVSKAGLAQLTRASALALAEYGIRVNAVGPGSVETDLTLTRPRTSEERKMMLSRTPLGRLGSADEIAAVAAFLASDEASYITGQTVYADGGRLPLNATVSGA